MRPAGDPRSRQAWLVLVWSVAVGLVLVVGLAGPVPGDRWILAQLHDVFGTSVDDPMGSIGTVTNTAPLLALTVVAVAVLWSMGRRDEAVAFAAVVLVAMAGNRLLKEIVARPRPDIRASPEPVSKYAYPSGHAANTMAVWMAMLVVCWRTRWRNLVLIGGAVAVAAVGFSRLAVGVHYPTDIVGGWLWVGAWAGVVWSWYRRHDHATGRWS